MSEILHDTIPGFTRSDVWCREAGISQRHGTRLRQEGLPYMRCGKWFWIHNEGGAEFFTKRAIGLKKKRVP
jgi:hypothetical protein